MQNVQSEPQPNTQPVQQPAQSSVNQTKPAQPDATQQAPTNPVVGSDGTQTAGQPVTLKQARPSKNDQQAAIAIGLFFVLILAGFGFYYWRQKQAQRVSLDAVPVVREVNELPQQDQNQNQGTNSGSVVADTEADSQPDQVQQLPPNVKKEVTKDTTLILEADKQTYQVGDNFNLNVYMTGTEVPDGVQFLLEYDPVQVTQVEFEKGTVFSMYLQTEVDTEQGEVWVMVVRSPGEELELEPRTLIGAVSGQFTQAGQIEFGFNQDRTKVAAGAGQNILQAATGLKLTVN